jgi:hypothetical protein
MYDLIVKFKMPQLINTYKNERIMNVYLKDHFLES